MKLYLAICLRILSEHLLTPKLSVDQARNWIQRLAAETTREARALVADLERETGMRMVELAEVAVGWPTDGADRIFEAGASRRRQPRCRPARATDGTARKQGNASRGPTVTRCHPRWATGTSAPTREAPLGATWPSRVQRFEGIDGETSRLLLRAARLQEELRGLLADRRTLIDERAEIVRMRHQIAEWPPRSPPHCALDRAPAYALGRPD